MPSLLRHWHHFRVRRGAWVTWSGRERRWGRPLVLNLPLWHSSKNTRPVIGRRGVVYFHARRFAHWVDHGTLNNWSVYGWLLYSRKFLRRCRGWRLWSFVYNGLIVSDTLSWLLRLSFRLINQERYARSSVFSPLDLFNWADNFLLVWNELEPFILGWVGVRSQGLQEGNVWCKVTHWFAIDFVLDTKDFQDSFLNDVLRVSIAKGKTTKHPE